MQGWAIVKHSVLLVLRNRKAALQITLVPIMVMIAVFCLFAGSMMQNDMATPGAGTGAAGVVVVLVGMVVLLGIAVNWHRFVILEEYPNGWFPPLRVRLLLGYLGRSIMIALLLALGFVPLLLITTGMAGGGLSMLIVVTLFISLLGLYLFFRMAAILPAGAVEQPITLGAAWSATRQGSGAIVSTVIILTLINMVLQGVNSVPVLGPILGNLIGAVFALVNVSILTTIYGHYVQGRPID